MIVKAIFKYQSNALKIDLGDQTLTNVEMYANTELQSEPQVIVEIMPDLFDGGKLTSTDTNFNEQQNDWWQATCEPVLILSSGNGKHPTDWWEMSKKIFCISCKIINAINEKDSNFSCVEYKEDQIVVTTCCNEPSTNKRFAMRINESETEYPTCKFEMIRLPCCDQFRPKSIIDDNIYNYEVCAKYSISCVSKVINKLPTKAMSWTCSRLKCQFRMW